ncbi:hypothetical protein FPANT_8486 [Fusarium pseudoanthophilum]|uniref:Uncharacterized protein n=1 Tax=Fusarium pseudoanthophilum TaxID=48495 RepID=A0A8H5KXS2_9HYPO|nr:hypothetical protein FPANT_8486 [Fusarium pseudoanthophilum]
MSAESCQSLVDGLMALRYEIQDMGQRIEDLVALRKQQSHRAKKVNEEEYQQALNSPSMIVLYEDYKEAVRYYVECQQAAFQRRAAFSHNYNRATENDQLEVYALEERWVRAAITAAEKRLNYLQDYPFAYKDKGAIISHVTAANQVLNSARKGLLQIERNKEENPHPTDYIYIHQPFITSWLNQQVNVPATCLRKGNGHALENSIVLVYGLHGVMSQVVHRECEIATETFAKKMLNWPNGRLEKPEIFKVESHDGQLRDSNDCFERFIGHLHDVFEVSPPKDLPVYTHAFVIMDGSCLENYATAMLVLAHKPEDEWRVGHCHVPIEVELGLVVESLRLGDVTETDVLD